MGKSSRPLLALLISPTVPEQHTYLIHNLLLISFFLDDESAGGITSGMSLSESEAEKQSGNRKIKFDKKMF